MNHIHDSKALALSRQVMALMYGPMPTGGSMQLQAKIQCMFVEAMAFAAGNSPVIPDGLIAAVNRLLDSDGSRGCYSAIQCGDAHKEVERLLAAAPQEGE